MWQYVVDLAATQVQGFVVVVNGGLHDYQFRVQDIEVICAVKTACCHQRLNQNDGAEKLFKAMLWSITYITYSNSTHGGQHIHICIYIIGNIVNITGVHRRWNWAFTCLRVPILEQVYSAHHLNTYYRIWLCNSVVGAQQIMQWMVQIRYGS